VIETTSNDVAGSYLIGNNPVRGLVTPDNSLLYVSNFASSSLSVYSIADGAVAGTVQVGSGPDALGLTRSGNFLLVADSRSGDVAVVRTAPLPSSSKRSAERSLITTIPVGAQPNQIVMVEGK
jgi:DNA-binding beta-propeller fold protein YncE